MTVNLKNFLNPKVKMSKMGEFQELQPIKGLQISSVSADFMVMEEMTFRYFIFKKVLILLQYIQHLRLLLLA